MHAATTVGSLVVDPPLVNGSGVVDAVSVDDDWNLPDTQLSRLGAFVTKTVTTRPRPGNPRPWAEVLADGTLLNAAGLPNPGIAAAMRDWAALPERLGVPVVVSVGGHADDLPALAAAVERAGWPSALELNLSCPNVRGGLVAGSADAVRDVVSRVRARTMLPIFAKLTPATGEPRAVAEAAVEAGADALTCGNTMPARAVSGDGTPLLGVGPDGGLSGAGLHALALRLVAEVRAAVDVPIVGLGGVDGEAAAMRMLASGATIVGVGTGAILDPQLPARLADRLSTPP